MDNEDKIKELEEKNYKLEEELRLTKEHLKKYTAPESRREYYVNNKEQILDKMKANPIPPDIRKKYNKKSYLRKKEKLKKEIEEKQNSENI